MAKEKETRETRETPEPATGGFGGAPGPAELDAETRRRTAEPSRAETREPDRKDD